MTRLVCRLRNFRRRDSGRYAPFFAHLFLTYAEAHIKRAPQLPGEGSDSEDDDKDDKDAVLWATIEKVVLSRLLHDAFQVAASAWVAERRERIRRRSQVAKVHCGAESGGLHCCASNFTVSTQVSILLLSGS
jgi:hypothetical protein